MTLRRRSTQLALAATLASGALGTPMIRAAGALPPSPEPAQNRETPAARRGGDLRSEQIDRATRVLALGPTGSLELKTISGDITITAARGREVHLEVVRRSRGRSEDEARQGLAEVQAVIDHQGGRATVTAAHKGDRRPPYRVDVSYVISAPPGTRITAGTISGNVNVRDIRGDLAVSSTSGDVMVSGAGQLASARSVSGNVTVNNVESTIGMVVRTVSGRIDLAEIRAARVEADTTSGDVSARGLRVERANLRTLSGTIEFQGNVARDGRYEFQSHSGNVRVSANGTVGFQLQASTFSGDIDADGNLNLRDVSRNRRSVRGSVGDGSAAVVASTFSGDISIARQ